MAKEYPLKFKKLLLGGKIYTMDRNYPVCDAMIVDGNKIAWLGMTNDLSSVPSDNYQVFELNGKVVLPGFIDSHTHLVFWAFSRQQIDLDGTKSYEESLKRISAFLKNKSLKKNDWLLGKGWKKEQWAKIVWPHKKDLDRLVPDNPAAIFSKDEHLLWVNSKALEIAGIDKNTPDPEGGSIERDKNGAPTGILKDVAMYLVYNHRKEPTLAEKMKVVSESMDDVFAQGCVGVSSLDQLESFEALQALDIAGKLPLRVTYYYRVQHMDDVIKSRIRTGYGSDFLKIGGIKIFADGALGSQTALMLKPFKGSTSNTGIEVTTVRELTEIISRCNKSGLACAIHAIGDKANRNVLDAVEAAGGHMSKRYRHRIEHCQIVSPSDIGRFKKLGVTASMQPTHATADIDLMKWYLGDRQKDSYRFKTLSRQGVNLCFGSDAPIEALNPLAGIYAATVGKLPGGRECYNSKELLTTAEAVRYFTLGGCEAVGEGEKRGSLTPGKLADFVVLDRDIMKSPPADLLKTSVVATFVDGELKYCQEGFNY